MANILVDKILFNSAISTKGSIFRMVDISNFYLITPLKQPEYIHIHIRGIPDEFTAE